MYTAVDLSNVFSGLAYIVAMPMAVILKSGDV